jgi:hypothetical protein
MQKAIPADGLFIDSVPVGCTGKEAANALINHIKKKGPVFRLGLLF